MNKHRIKYIVFILLISINICGILFVVLNNRIEKSKVYESFDSNYTNYSYSVRRNFEWELLNDGHSFNPGAIVTTNKGKMDIRDLIVNKPVLFFFISIYECNVCIDDEVNILKSFVTHPHPSNIYIIKRFESERLLHVFEKEQGLNALMINNETLDLPLENINSPFYFVIMPNLMTTHSYVPDFSNIENSRAYLSTIITKINSYTTCNE